MRYFLTLCLALIWAVSVSSAQNFAVFNLDPSQFPVIKAKLYAYDASGGQARPSASEITVSEGGIPRTVLSVTCPPQQPVPPLSLAMSIDISGSMGYGGTGDIPVELGKTTVRTIMPLITDPASEFALQTCNDRALIVQDFTTQRDRIISALGPIQAGGGNDFVEHLLNPLTGLLNLAKTGAHKRIALLYTDAWWPPLSAGELQRCKDTCASYAIEFYAVIYSSAGAEPNGIKASLQALANATGGQLIDGVTSQQGAAEIAARLQQQAQGGTPCEITWQSGISCADGVRSVSFAWSGQTAQGSYTALASAVARLDLAPAALFFHAKPVGIRFDTTVTVTAVNMAFTVTSITSSNPAYDISPKSFTLPAGGSRTLTVSYTPPDSGLTWTRFDFQTDLCPQTYYASGGYRGVRPVTQTLKLVQPNGGEVFPVGIDTAITWTGIPPTDVVDLEFSADNGVNWGHIASGVSGGSYLWRTPPPPSTQCLVRVTQLSSGAGSDSVVTLTGHENFVAGVAWSLDGSKVVTGSWDRSTNIWDATTGALLQTLKKGKSVEVLGVAWSPDGSRVAVTSGTGGQTPTIWEVSTGKILQSLAGHGGANVNGVAWSPDGSKLATAGADNTAKIWDAGSGALLRTFTGHGGPVTGVAWSPDGSKIVTGSTDNTAKIWDAATGAVIRTLAAHTAAVNGVAWNGDGSMVATASSDRTAKVWDASTGTVLRTLTGHSGGVNGVAWSPDGSMVATASSDRTAKVWDAGSGTVVQTFTGHANSVAGIAWSPDGNKVATASYDLTAKIWGVDPSIFIQSDISDGLFSIVMPQPKSVDVDMGRVLAGTVRDSVVQGFVGNAGAYPFRVREIQIVGADASQFSQISGIPPFDVTAGGSHPIELRFHPTSAGSKSAQILVITQSDTLRQALTGEGLVPSLAVVSRVVDFGKVKVGQGRDSLGVLTIVNISPVPLTITASHHAGPNDQDFSTLAGSAPFALQPGDTARLDLRFLPSAVGRTSGRLLFDYGGEGSPATVELFGEGVDDIPSEEASATIALQGVSASAGDEIAVPVLLNESSNLLRSGATKLTATLRFNATLLDPIGTTPRGSIIGGERVIPLELPAAPVSGNVLATLQFRAMLGNDTTTALTLENGRGVGGVVAVRTESGAFHLLGVCPAGGARLLNPDGQVAILKISPNPANGTSEMEIETVESGRTRVAVMDMLGREVKVVCDGELPPGQHTLTINSAGLGTGNYFVQLRTQTVVRIARMSIVR